MVGTWPDIAVSKPLVAARRLTARRLCELVRQTAKLLPRSAHVSHVAT